MRMMVPVPIYFLSLVRAPISTIGAIPFPFSIPSPISITSIHSWVLPSSPISRSREAEVACNVMDNCIHLRHSATGPLLAITGGDCIACVEAKFVGCFWEWRKARQRRTGLNT